MLEKLRGTVVDFLPGYEPAVSAAVVRLDAPLSVNGVTGAILIMELRYEGASWESGEPGVQTVGLALCSERPTGPAPQSGHGTSFDTHAIFETL